MGIFNSFRRDPNVDIHLQVGKQLYLPGQRVQGNVYLNIKNVVRYGDLRIKFQGKQYCYWQIGSGDDRQEYTNNRDTYEKQFLLKTFGSSINPGQYTFPFSLILPNTLPGSFHSSDHNYIHYYLNVILTTSDGKNDNQIGRIYINVRQWIPNDFHSLTVANITRGGCCCNCFGSYGQTLISLHCNTNIITNGQQIIVTGNIDNRGSNKLITNVRLVLIQHRVLTCQYGRQKTNLKFINYTLADNLIKQVPASQSRQFKVEPRIPDHITQEEALGNITAIWYTIMVVGDQGTCNSQPPSASLRMRFQSKNPKLIMNPSVDPPQNWHPIVYPAVHFSNMPPYFYNPNTYVSNFNLKEVPVNNGNMNMYYPPSPNEGFQQQNQGNYQNQKQNQNQGYQPYFEENSGNQQNKAYGYGGNNETGGDYYNGGNSNQGFSS